MPFKSRICHCLEDILLTITQVQIKRGQSTQVQIKRGQIRHERDLAITKFNEI